MASASFLESVQDRPPFGCHSPRISFSYDIANTDIDDPKDLPEEKKEVLDTDSTSEFEFSMINPATDIVSDDSMMLSADELFFKGRLLPLHTPQKCQNMDHSSLQEARTQKESMGNRVERRTIDQVLTVSSLITDSTAYVESEMEFYPTSPKAPTCSASFKELFGVRKQQVQGAEDGLSCEKRTRHKVSKPAKPRRMFFKSCDVGAIDSCSSHSSNSSPANESPDHQTVLHSSHPSNSSPLNESSDYHSSFRSSSGHFSSLTPQPEPTRSDNFLAKCVSVNLRFLDQKHSSPTTSFSREDARENNSSRMRRDTSSPRTSVSRNEGGNYTTSKLKKDDSVSREKGGKDAATSKAMKENAHGASVKSGGISSPGRVSGGISPGRNNSQVMSPGRPSEGGSPGDRCKAGRISMLSSLGRSSSSSQNVWKKHEQMRNARQRDCGRGLERSTSYSSVRVTPVLNLPPIHVSPCTRYGKGSKPSGMFGFSQLFTPKKEKATKVSPTVTFLQQMNHNEEG